MKKTMMIAALAALACSCNQGSQGSGGCNKNKCGTQPDQSQTFPPQQSSHVEKVQPAAAAPAQVVEKAAEAVKPTVAAPEIKEASQQPTAPATASTPAIKVENSK